MQVHKIVKIYLQTRNNKTSLTSAKKYLFLQSKNTHTFRKIAGNDLTTKRWCHMACAKCEKKNLPVHQAKRFFLSKHSKHLSDRVAV